LNKKGTFFITRQKRNTTYGIAKRHPILKSKGLTCDQTIFVCPAKPANPAT